MSRKIRRSNAAHRRKMFRIWVATLLVLVGLVVYDAVLVYQTDHPERVALAAERDYSKIHFQGMALGDEITIEKMSHHVTDATYKYIWKNISIAVDDENHITQLGFYAMPDVNEKTNISIADAVIDYRGRFLTSLDDFKLYFGNANFRSFERYKYVTYSDDKYNLELTLMDDEIYNVVLSKK